MLEGVLNEPLFVRAVLAAVPSGAPEIVHLRERARRSMVGPGYRVSFQQLAGVRHAPLRLPVPPTDVYVGSGDPSIIVRPSPWTNWFVHVKGHENSDFLFCDFAWSRADRVEWLQPLFGKATLLCCVIWCRLAAHIV